MYFVSLFSYPYLLVAGIVFYSLPATWRAPFLLMLSYIFIDLSSNHFKEVLILIGATLFIYGTGWLIALTPDESKKNILLYASVGAIVALLVNFKARGALHGFILPLGISYYSFKLISYIIEVYWDERAVEKNLGIFCLYTAFFPQIVSGPIQRPQSFFAQIREVVKNPANFSQIEEGYRLVLGGLMMKLLIGDRIAAFIEVVDKSPTDYKWTVILITIFCYTLQLFADFSGYTNIAIGIGKIFGIDAPANFKAPFAAANIQQMWQRWHISLTSWVADYLFTPLNMAFRHLGKCGLILCIIINMVVIGLWHGFTFNFLVFGLCHALFVIITVLTAGWRNALFGKSKFLNILRFGLGILVTFTLMSFSQIFWHTGTWEAAITHLQLLTGNIKPGHLGFKDVRLDLTEPLFICMGLTFYIGTGAPGFKRIGTIITGHIPNWALYGFYIFVISALNIETGSKFIYGQF